MQGGFNFLIWTNEIPVSELYNTDNREIEMCRVSGGRGAAFVGRYLYYNSVKRPGQYGRGMPNVRAAKIAYILLLLLFL